MQRCKLLDKTIPQLNDILKTDIIIITMIRNLSMK